MLILPTISPIAATNGQLLYHVDYRENTYHTYGLFTPKGDFLVGETSFSLENGKSVYRSDLSLITRDGDRKKVAVQNPYTYEYNGQFFAAAFDVHTYDFTLYDEELNLIASENVPFANRDITVRVNPYKEYIVFSQTIHDLSSGNISTTSKYYNFLTKSFETHVDIPINYAYVDDRKGIILVNELNEIKQIIPFNHISYSGKPYDAFYVNNQIVLFTKEQREQLIFHIFVFSLDGTMLKQQMIKMDPNIREANLLFKSFKDDIFTLEPRSSLYDLNWQYQYNLKNNTITPIKKPAPSNTDSWQVNDHVYAYYTDNNGNEITTFKTADGKEIVSFPFYDAVNNVYTSATTQDDNLLLTKYDNATAKTSAQLYDLKTATLIGELSGYTSYNLTNKHNYLYAVDEKNRKQHGHSENLKGALYYFGNDTIPTPEPVGPTYEPTKIWTVTTSKAIDAKKVTTNNVYVKNAKGEDVPVMLSFNANQLFIHAPRGGYESNETYILYVEDLFSVDGDKLKEPKSKQFTIK